MGPIGRCLSAFCIVDNKAVVFPPDSRINEAKLKGAAAGAGCCGNITGSGPIIGGCIGLLQYHQDFQVAMMASLRHLKARILTMTMKP